MRALPSLTQLRYLVALHECGHFGRAAEKCFVTQSTLSASIRDLEATLEVVLVERDKRHVAFTGMGEAVVDRARGLLSQATDLIDLCTAERAPLSGRFRLGIIPSIAPFVLPHALGELRRRYPLLRLELRELLSAACIDGLMKNTLDVVVFALPYDVPTLIETRPLYDDEFLFVTRQSKLGTASRALDLHRIEPDTLLLLEDGHCLRDHALAACNLSEQSTQSVSATSLTTLVHMVESGLGNTLLPELAIAGGLLNGTSLYTRRFSPRGPARQVALAYRRTTPQRASLKVLEEIFSQTKGFTGARRAKTSRLSRRPH